MKTSVSKMYKRHEKVKKSEKKCKYEHIPHKWTEMHFVSKLKMVKNHFFNNFDKEKKCKKFFKNLEKCKNNCNKI